jgi:hypothetical protein
MPRSQLASVVCCAALGCALPRNWHFTMTTAATISNIAAISKILRMIAICFRRVMAGRVSAAQSTDSRRALLMLLIQSRAAGLSLFGVALQRSLTSLR